MREANLTVSDSAFDAMGIAELVSLSREAGIRSFEELSCHGTGAVVQVGVESRYDEQSLSALDCVDRWEHISETDDGHLYVIEFTAPGLPETLADDAADLIGPCDPDLGEREATMSLVGSQESIAAAIRDYKRAGAAPTLEKLGPYDGGSRPLADLTDRQREVVRIAFELGYYEVPREVSTAEIAGELDIDPSTASEHLQRAERNVLGELFRPE